MVINFIDDSTNIIGFNDHGKIQGYMEKYYVLLSKFYNINKLKINNDKNKMIIINKPKWDNIFKNFTFKAGNHIVKAKPKIKNIGYMVTKQSKNGLTS